MPAIPPEAEWLVHSLKDMVPVMAENQEFQKQPPWYGHLQNVEEQDVVRFVSSSRKTESRLSSKYLPES